MLDRINWVRFYNKPQICL